MLFSKKVFYFFGILNLNSHLCSPKREVKRVRIKKIKIFHKKFGRFKKDTEFCTPKKKVRKKEYEAKNKVKKSCKKFGKFK